MNNKKYKNFDFEYHQKILIDKLNNEAAKLELIEDIEDTYGSGPLIAKKLLELYHNWIDEKRKGYISLDMLKEESYSQNIDVVVSKLKLITGLNTYRLILDLLFFEKIFFNLLEKN